jgi:hypothetical protein
MRIPSLLKLHPVWRASLWAALSILAGAIMAGLGSTDLPDRFKASLGKKTEQRFRPFVESVRTNVMDIELKFLPVAVTFGAFFCFMAYELATAKRQSNILGTVKIAATKAVRLKAKKDIRFRVAVYLEPSTAEAKNLTVTIESIEAVVKSPNDNLDIFRGLALKRVGSYEKTFKINPHDTFLYDVLKRIITADQQSWAGDKLYVCHANAFRPKRKSDVQREISGRDSKGRDLIADPDNTIQRKDYDITIKATAEHMTECIAKFALRINKKGIARLQRIS